MTGHQTAIPILELRVSVNIAKMKGKDVTESFPAKGTTLLCVETIINRCYQIVDADELQSLRWSAVDHVMNTNNLYKILIISFLLSFTASCATTKMIPPKSDTASILVLPLQVENTSNSSNYAFAYGYQITNVDDESLQYETVFKLPNKEGYLIVDSIPPGFYFVSKIKFIPVGTGAKTYGEGTARYDTFELIAGKITIFPISLDVAITRDPTDTSRTHYRMLPSLLKQPQRNEILGKLQALENFDQWEVLEPNVAAQEPAGFREYQGKYLPDYRAFATNISTGRWGRSGYLNTPKQAMDQALNFCEETGQECTIYALGDKVVYGLPPAELLAALEEYYYSVSPGLARKSPELMIGNRISADEITTLLSGVSVIGRTQNRLKYKATWKSNGEIIGEAISLGNIERKSKDTGTWSLEDGKLCRQWRQWSGGRLECLEVTKKNNQLYAYDVHMDIIEDVSLANEKVSTRSNAIPNGQSESGTNITGTYRSEITSDNAYYFRKKSQRNLLVTLKQEGTSITGTDNLTGTELTGTLEGDTIKFKFWSKQIYVPGGEAKGEWKVIENTNRLEGFWRHRSSSVGGIWNLTRVE
jgi:hypothetical protein